MKPLFDERVQRLRGYFTSLGVESSIVTSLDNIYYYSGYTGTSATLVITLRGQYLITDFRYKEQAVEECKDFEILITDNEHGINWYLKSLVVGKIAFEDESVTVKEFNEYLSVFGEDRLIGLGDTLTRLRMIKDPVEIDFIRRAGAIADKAFDHILNYLEVGISELDVALELEYFMKKHGASKLSFDSIVASGKRSSLPHGSPTPKLIEYGDFVTMDFGCVYNGYCSDMTRTVVLGRASDKQREIYGIVLEAQLGALHGIKSGVSTKDIDNIARNIIKSYGYGDYFGHGLGHGVGIQIHELPVLNQKENNNVRLLENMVITDEPGIYIPNFGGVRIEDLVLVTKEGYEVLSNSPKELIEL